MSAWKLAPWATEDMELAGREYARAHAPSTFADIFNTMLSTAPPVPDAVVERMCRAHHAALGAFPWGRMREDARDHRRAAMRAALAAVGADQ